MKIKKTWFGQIQLTLSQRELDILYAGFVWTPDIDVIDASNEEFDNIINELYPYTSDEAKDLD